MSRPLKMFMRGKRITMLQESLKRMGYPMEDQPGLFGAFTRDAVKAYQKQHTLKPTGIVDDDLLQMMQQGPLATGSKAEPADKELISSLASVNQRQLDALIQLLIHKELITEAELQQQISRPQTLRVTQLPLV